METTTENTPPEVEDVQAGHPIPVGVGEIDKELLTLWQATAAAPAEEARVAVTLVRVLNLITYVEGDDRADEVNNVIRRITGRHPCRSLLLICQGNDNTVPGHMTAWISAHCQLPTESGKQICSEQVSIAAEGAAVSNMYGLALELLVPDIPVFLWWTSNQPLEDQLLSHLADSIDRLIVDSSIFKDPVGSLIKMAGLGDARRPVSVRRAMSDFNWTRLTAWREITAQFFDLPALRRYINGITSVEIDYAAPDPGQVNNPVQALLYAGWLASRLDWTFEGAVQGNNNARFEFHLVQDGHPNQHTIKPEDADCLTPGGMTEARLLSGRPGQAEFHISCHAKDKYATSSVSVGGVEPTVRTMVYIEPDEAELLNLELEMFDHDVMYEQALHMAALFARGSEPTQRWSILA
jgi:glucose-6-phosphate dehydrogenase assembly protein OpcA